MTSVQLNEKQGNIQLAIRVFKRPSFFFRAYVSFVCLLLCLGLVIFPFFGGVVVVVVVVVLDVFLQHDRLCMFNLPVWN